MSKSAARARSFPTSVDISADRRASLVKVLNLYFLEAHLQD